MSEDVRLYYNNFLDYLRRDHERENPRHQQVKQRLREIIRTGMRVLDIGCGTGISSRFMGDLGATVIGVDISDKLIEFARDNSSHPNVTYFVADATQLDLDTDFDVITIIDCMEHIPKGRRNDFIASISRHVLEQTVVYLNIPDSRYQRYVKRNHPGKQQIVDEDYDCSLILSLFSSIGFEPYSISIYGVDTRVQYNEYLFSGRSVLEESYRQILGPRDRIDINGTSHGDQKD